MQPITRFLVAAGLILFPVLHASAEPYTIRVGCGVAAEDQLWLMKALPSVTPNQNKAYKLEMTVFPGGDKRFEAFEAGELDIATGPAPYVLFGASQGLSMKAVASISREQSPAFVTQYLVADASPIKTVADLKGKIIGINAPRAALEIWARAALSENGLNPDRDVKWAVLPLSAMGEAVRSGRIDIGSFPEPFAAAEAARGGMRTVFTSKTGMPWPEELMLLVASPDFLKKHPDEARAFLADFVSATHYLLDHPHKARQALLDSKMVLIPPAIYLDMADNYRTRDARIDVPAVKKDQDFLIKLGFQKQPVDVDKLVDLSYLPN
jgi:ABC-type nitrate/sulfonate/bicarbonate transport system substrate-binding protein